MPVHNRMNPNIPCPCGSGRIVSECHKKPNPKWEYICDNHRGEPVYNDKSLELITKQRLDEIESRAYKVTNKQEAFDLLDEMYHAVAPGMDAITAQSSCRKGCAACCYQAIPSTPLEVARIKKFMATDERKELWMNKIRELKDHYPKANGKANFSDLAGPYFFEGRPCPFLDLEDNTCGIYPVRPQTCRNHMVMTDPALCHAKELKQVGIYHSPVYMEQTTRICIILNAMIYPEKKPEFLVHLF